MSEKQYPYQLSDSLSIATFVVCCNLDRRLKIASVICGILGDRLSASTHNRTGVKNQRRQTPKVVSQQLDSCWIRLPKSLKLLPEHQRYETGAPAVALASAE